MTPLGWLGHKPQNKQNKHSSLLYVNKEGPDQIIVNVLKFQTLSYTVLV